LNFYKPGEVNTGATSTGKRRKPQRQHKRGGRKKAGGLTQGDVKEEKGDPFTEEERNFGKGIRTKREEVGRLGEGK